MKTNKFKFPLQMYFVGLIFFSITYSDSYHKNKVISETPSKFGGYLADGKYTYCEDLIPDYLKQSCKEEKTQGLGVQYPWLMQLMYFGIAPLFCGGLAFFIEKYN